MKLKAIELSEEIRFLPAYWRLDCHSHAYLPCNTCSQRLHWK